MKFIKTTALAAMNTVKRGQATRNNRAWRPFRCLFPGVCSSFSRYRLFLALAISLAPLAALAQDDDDSYTDVIYFKNGDRVTGNIKELDRGKLRVRTMTMDTIYVNWVDVEAVDSDKYLRIEQTDGSFTSGRLQGSGVAGVLGVLDHGNLVHVHVNEVAAIRPLRVDQSFFNRIEGDIKAGVDYKKAGDILTVNVASSARLREEMFEIGMGFDWNETARTGTNDSSRASLYGDYTRFRGNRWFWRGAGALERNDELGLNLRALVSGSIGRYLTRSETRRWQVNVGMASNFEEKITGERTESLEGMIQSTFDIFVLSIPVTRLTASASIFPSFTETNRVRANSSITLRNEIIRDLFWDLQFYSNYDNQPVQGAQKRDYGIVTSIGATF